ncbi:uncharacterized protein LOC117168521 [Belonocnema kinseyi]|uniref:uncharacterized protein LOC117168521 n=1 Tax=Belonocnema kinseyi TaxID=2817044 RepID=UPI00143D7787|nr:uncharacterized protein LOC117168521 [Belonocnema kinseyi]
MHGSCGMTEEELEKNIFEYCRNQVAVQGSESFGCFNGCVAMKFEVIKDMKFNEEKYVELVLTYNPYMDREQLIDAYQFCVNDIPKVNDECALFTEMVECVTDMTWLYFPTE